MTATVIIPTTGTPDLNKAIESVLSQTYMTTCYVVCDGEQHRGKVKVIAEEYGDKVKVANLPINVGANGFYGHRVYAAFTHLVNTDYVLYLDQDCYLDQNHVFTQVENIKKKKLDWSYSLRKIVDKDGNYLCNDDCESLGKWKCFQDYHHIDTNCYCLKTDIAIRLSSAWHGGWGQDRIFLNALSTHFKNYDCTGEYTLNYKLAGNEGSVKPEFFLYGNKVMNEHYKGKLPWRK